MLEVTLRMDSLDLQLVLLWKPARLGMFCGFVSVWVQKMMHRCQTCGPDCLLVLKAAAQPFPSCSHRQETHVWPPRINPAVPPRPNDTFNGNLNGIERGLILLLLGEFYQAVSQSLSETCTCTCSSGANNPEPGAESPFIRSHWRKHQRVSL